MNILHVTAQKPTETGSGVYLTGLARGFSALPVIGSQGILAGVYREDIPVINESLSAFAAHHESSPVTLYPVVFNSDALPFHIFAMSDVMPYPSSLYRSMTGEQLALFSRAFLTAADEAVRDLKPDVIICHHLYLLTSLIREHFPDIPVIGFCHNTDLTQFGAHDLAHELILQNIPKLDAVCALHEQQKHLIADMLHVPAARIHVVGAGYDSDVFFANTDTSSEPDGESLSFSDRTDTERTVHFVFTGKISRAKGLAHLMRALPLVAGSDPELNLSFTMVGGAGDRDEYDEIRSLAGACPYPVVFTGRISEEKLVSIYRRHDCFILPSLNEGLPLCVIEALACGLSVVMTDLPGIRSWLDSHLPDAPILYVDPPCVEDDAAPVGKDFSGLHNVQGTRFEHDLARAVSAAASNILSARTACVPDLSSLTWEGLARRVLGIVSECKEQ